MINALNVEVVIMNIHQQMEESIVVHIIIIMIQS